MEKEPFYKSTRFWVSVLTPIVTAGLAVAAESIPAVKDLPSETVVFILASVVVMGVTYVLARTQRNTPTKS